MLIKGLPCYKYAPRISGFIKQEFKVKYITLFIIALLSPYCVAVEKNSDYHHAVSLGGGIGLSDWLEDNGLEDDLLNMQAHYDIAYRYQVNSRWGTELGYMYQKVTGSPAFTPLLGPKIKDLSSLRIVVAYSYPISQQSDLVFKLGAARYSIDEGFLDDDYVNTDSEGTSFISSLGWRYKFQSNFEFSLMYSYQKFDTQTLTASAGYRF